ncbi:MAG: hypothetical protein HQ534_12070 [Armatimonadetes bacterium]|nr:hypothetical protein [Armatimonadota bacterium]
MNSKSARIVFLFVILASSFNVLLSIELTADEEAWLEKANRYEKDGWIFVHIEGKPFERGFQHGYLLANELKEVLRINKFLAEWYTGEDFNFFVEHANKMFTSKIDEEFMQEMEGIAAGATKAGFEISLEEIIGWNGFTELFDYWWPTIVGEMPLKNEKCSAFIATGKYTKDGKIVMAHNSWTIYAAGQFFNIILDIKPEKGHQILMQSSPGLIESGTDYFVTDAGLIGTETTIGGYTGFDPEKTPEFNRVRKAMQYAQTIEEWVEIMKTDNNGAYANSWLLGDVNTGEIARFEQGLKYDSFEKTSDGYYSGENVASDLKIRNQECSGAGYSDIRTPMGARRVRWKQLLTENMGKIDNELAKEFLADHYDVYLQKENKCTRNICGHYDLDPMQYWPERLPFAPQGCVDGKVVDSSMAKNMQMWARWGCSCGTPFDAEKFIEEHQQYDWLEGYLEDRPAQQWAEFSAEE